MYFQSHGGSSLCFLSLFLWFNNDRTDMHAGRTKAARRSSIICWLFGSAACLEDENSLSTDINITNWCYRHEQFANNNSKLSIGRGEKEKEKVLVLLQGWVNFAKKKNHFKDRQIIEEAFVSLQYCFHLYNIVFIFFSFFFLKKSNLTAQGSFIKVAGNKFT